MCETCCSAQPFQDWPSAPFYGRGDLQKTLRLLGPELDFLSEAAVSGLPFLPPDQAFLCLQPNEYIKTLADMKVTLKELCWLLRDEHRSLTELQQQFAKAKATWETERAELKGHASQVSLLACQGHPAPHSKPASRQSCLGGGC